MTSTHVVDVTGLVIITLWQKKLPRINQSCHSPNVFSVLLRFIALLKHRLCIPSQCAYDPGTQASSASPWNSSKIGLTHKSTFMSIVYPSQKACEYRHSVWNRRRPPPVGDGDVHYLVWTKVPIVSTSCFLSTRVPPWTFELAPSCRHRRQHCNSQNLGSLTSHIIVFFSSRHSSVGHCCVDWTVFWTNIIAEL